MEIIFKLVFYFIHFIWDLCDLILLFLTKIRTNSEQLWLNFAKKVGLINSYKSYFQILPKVPTHFAITISEDSLSYKDLSNLLIWCLINNISFVSICDQKGDLKKDSSKFFNYISRCKDQLLKKDSHKYAIKISCAGLLQDYLGIEKNGYKTSDLHVNLLSNEDGRGDIVQAASKVCEDVVNNVVSPPRTILPEFKKHLKANSHFPDPEVLLVFGKAKCLYGFHPWYIRVTEIYFLPSHINVKYKEFVDVLSKFSKVEQRFGI